MRLAWRLAINSIWARKGRSFLLILAVALSAALIVVVSTAIASINKATQARMASQLGRADIAINAPGAGQTFDQSVLERARDWPETDSAAGRLEGDLGLRTVLAAAVLRETAGSTGESSGAWSIEKGRFNSPVLGIGSTDPDNADFNPIDLVAGRLPTGDLEVVIDGLVIERLSLAYAQSDEVRDLWATADLDLIQQAIRLGPVDPTIESNGVVIRNAEDAAAFNREQLVRVGSVLEMPRFLRAPIQLRVVGIAQQPPLGGRPTVFMNAATMQRLKGADERLSRVDVILKDDADAEAVARARGESFQNQATAAGTPPLLIQTTAKITAGLEDDIAASRLGMILSTVIAFLSASFIILTGMNVDLADRRRSLAVLRSIGATRAQLFGAQMFTGTTLGVLGAIVGVPMGLGIAVGAITVLKEQVPTGMAVSWLGLLLASGGSVVSGMLGATWSAWSASRMSPLQGLSGRARPISRRLLWGTVLVGFAGLATQFAIITLPRDGQVVFWGYATVGLPAMLTGYFILGAPLVVLLSYLAAPIISRLFGLPAGLLGRHVRATPFRYGLTAGALMGGLGLMIAIWTQGGSLLNDYLGRLKFPDAFATGTAFTDDSVARVQALPEVDMTCPITLHPIQTDAFGVRALQQYRSNFIAFDPELFFELAELQWVEGEPEVAIQRLKQGGAVIVAREFQIAQGLGVGDIFRCRNGVDDGTGSESVTHEFEIVGVVTSPGLDIVSKFFDVGADFVDQAIHAVFGTRADLKAKFGTDAIHMIQMRLNPETPDAEAITAVRAALFTDGLITAGSGREIKAQIVKFATAGLFASSAIAVLSMLIACFGVANVIIAGIQQRRYEFGVLRAIGGTRWLLVRLVAAEAALIAIAAGVLGTMIGVQGAYAGIRMNMLLFGLDLRLNPPPLPIAIGWAIVMVLTLSAAAPAIWRLNREKPRELLASGRG